MALQNSDPVFVIGIVRSGTSLLFSLLNQHPRIALMFECDIWSFPKPLLNLRFQGDWLARQEFFNQALSRHRLVLGHSLRGLEKVEGPEDLYRAFGQAKTGTVWGEKSPFYCDRLLHLARRFPQSRFILLWRDPVEIYRSVTRAGRRSRFFARPGMLSRLIRYREEMIRQAAELHQQGHLVHHVTYDVLVNQPEKTCRAICEFLQVEFEPKMLDISQADFSAVFPESHHDHLRRGKIERQEFPERAVEPAIVDKLQRYQSRWHRLASQWLPGVERKSESPEPGFWELSYHKIAGSALNAWDGAKRVAFEFLPLPWLRTYREMKAWFTTHQPLRDRAPFRRQFATHWITILTSYLFLASVGIFDYLSGPNVSLAPFYLVPCAALALVVNRRWGAFAALLSATIWSVLQDLGHPMAYGLVLWNLIMRFLVFEVVVILLDRIRVQLNSPSST